jgi:hypothetical protein
VVLRIVLCLALLAAPFFPPNRGQHEGELWYTTYAAVGMGVILFDLAYWYVYIKIIPSMNGHRVQDEVRVLEDSITVTTLVKVA